MNKAVNQPNENIAYIPRKILVSGLGSLAIEVENNKYQIVSDKSFDGDKEFDDEQSAIDSANEIMYHSILEKKLEKSIRSENVVLLTGAGASKECGGPLMPDLWEAAKESLDLKSKWDQMLIDAGYSPEEGKENLEDLLSNMQTISRANKLDSSTGTDFSDEIKTIEKIIASKCEEVKITDSSSHVHFLSRVLRGRSASSPRLKVFTLNYDTAFEQAGERIEAVVIDGFLFSYKSGFKSYEFNLDIVQRERSRIHHEENFYSKVFQLYKLHGSINWENNGGEITKGNNVENPVLIYPNSSKFEKSFDMPFFEMVSRLQSILRKENTTLFIVGYSFGDSHVNRIIGESVRNNLNLEVFVVKPTLENNGLIAEFTESIKAGKKNIHLIGNKFDQFVKGLPDVKIGVWPQYQESIDEDKSI